VWVFPLGAAVVAGVFSAMLWVRWLTRRGPHLAAWAAAMAMFAVASGAAAVGILDAWTAWWYRIYYLFGAIINVPVLALGTVYLLAPRRAGHAAAAVVAIAAVFAAGSVITVELDPSALMRASEASQIASGREVMPEGPRTLSRYYSYTGFVVVVAGALWSAWKLSRTRRERFRNLTVGNIHIAVGTTVVAVASAFARFGSGSVFAVGLLVGVVLMFAGFLRTLRASPEGAAEAAEE
jgi:hypothetical protein